MKLISCTDYVVYQREKGINDNTRRFLACEKYVKFLKRPLELGMFIPTDKEGNVLEDVKLPLMAYEEISISIRNKYEQYQEAKQRVLFEGITSVELTPNSLLSSNRIIIFRKDEDPLRFDKISGTIEQLVNRVTLTEEAIKQL